MRPSIFYIGYSSGRKQMQLEKNFWDVCKVICVLREWIKIPFVVVDFVYTVVGCPTLRGGCM